MDCGKNAGNDEYVYNILGQPRFLIVLCSMRFS